MTDHQPSLFSASELRGCYKVTPTNELVLNAAALTAWKQRIFDYQQNIRQALPVQQTSLFDLLPAEPITETAPAPDGADPDSIDPFNLPRQNTEFWRWQFDSAGVAALYFVIDYEWPLLLYVGETVKSNQRWKGEHDCKRYLLNYRQAHYQQHCASTVGIAFWPHAPAETRPRQKLELALIKKWRSPFNKENWQIWATPFIAP